MTVFPFQISEISGVYNRIANAKLKASTLFASEQHESQDIVSISAEGKKHIVAQTKNDVLAKIRETK